MLNRSKFILATLAALMLLSLAVGTASANRLNVTEVNFEEIFTPPMTNLTFSAAGNNIICPTIRLGTYVARTIAKGVNGLLGRIRHVVLGTCTGGTATVLTETLPWEMGYSSFSGTLPRITGITTTLIGESIRVEPGRNTPCLVRTTATEPEYDIIENFNASSQAENIRADETRSIRLGGGFICSLAGSGTVSGVALERNLPGTGLIAITLI